MSGDENIWEGDKLHRKEEAGTLIGYLESMAARRFMREDSHGFVLAVDAPYGRGKSWFLRRFAKEMGKTHPVAFVDAWTDDLQDEPLVALAATLLNAFEQQSHQSPELKARLSKFVDRAGKVAKISAIGAAKRGLAYLITEGAVEAIGALGDVSEDAEKAIGKATDDVIDKTTKQTPIASASMEARIAEFNQARTQVENMKAALRDLVAGVAQQEGLQLPIVIVIDELDRCRPNYAIKLLEEIKHLFDVEGVAFVLGMHASALSHSVAVLYGANFDGADYLSRFINQRYSLKEARLERLVHDLVEQRNLPLKRMAAPEVLQDERREEEIHPGYLIGSYMKEYGLGVRDAFQVVNTLETCLALTHRDPLLLPLLLPMIFAKIKQVDFRDYTPAHSGGISFMLYDEFRSKHITVDHSELWTSLRELALKTPYELSFIQPEENDQITFLFMRYYRPGEMHSLFSRPNEYQYLLSMVGRFKSFSPSE